MKSKIGSLANSSLIYGIGSILNKSLDFLLLPLFTRYLAPIDYGIISNLTMFNFVLTSIFSFGLATSTGVLYFLDQENQERKNTVIYSAVFVLFVSSIVMVILGILFSSQLSLIVFHEYGFDSFLIISLITASFINMITPLMNHLQFEQKAKKYVLLTNLTSIITILITVAFVMWFNLGVAGMVFGTMIAKVISFLIFFVLKDYKPKIDLEISKELVKEGLPMMPSFISLFILYQGNRQILQYITKDLGVIGIYSVGYNLGFAMTLFVNAFTPAWMPYFLSFNNKLDEAKVLFGKIFTYYTYFFGSLSLMFFICAKPAIMIMTQAKYLESYKVVGFASSGQFLYGIFALFLPAVYFAREVKYSALCQMVAVIFSLIFNFVFINLFGGLVGAGLGLALGALAMAGAQHFWNISQKERYFQAEYEWNRIFIFSVVYVIFAFLTILNRDLNLIYELVLSLFESLILAGIMFKLVSKSEKEDLKEKVSGFIAKKFNRKTA